MNEDDLEARIRARAYRVWLEEGKPDGRAEAHWDLAKLIVAEEDGLEATLSKPEQPRSEPIEAIENQAEFPTLTDQGEMHIPGEGGGTS